MRRRRLALVAFAAGAVTAYLYDPENGPARRENLRHQSQSWTRRVSEAADKRRGYASGRANGPESHPKGSGQFHPESQADPGMPAPNKAAAQRAT